jgi:hypothetical protein
VAITVVAICQLLDERKYRRKKEEEEKYLMAHQKV